MASRVARRAFFRYIETWYNRRRRHSTVGYVRLLGEIVGVPTSTLTAAIHTLTG